MTADILVNVSPREVRAALVENGILQEILLERANKRGLISNIYKGRVSRVLPVDLHIPGDPPTPGQLLRGLLALLELNVKCVS